MKNFCTFTTVRVGHSLECLTINRDILNPLWDGSRHLNTEGSFIYGFSLLRALSIDVALPIKGLKSRYDEFLSWHLQSVKSNKRAFYNLLPDLSHVILYGNLKIMQWSGKLIPKGGRGLTYFY